jgi:hypothetical protein
LAFSKKTWQAVRIEWETGEASLKKLSEKYGMSVPAIERKKKIENWVKGELKPIVQAMIEEKTLDIVARLGMPKPKLIEYILDGMNAEKIVVYGKDSGEGFVDKIPDHSARVKYLEQLCKITGLYSPDKHIVANVGSIADQIKARWSEA